MTYIGSALISDESRVDVRDDPVKSDNRESITDTEGTYSSSIKIFKFVCLP